ncbi:hypothetical protein PUNSTDRAFT_122372 [Punctularia strigosozonata HHB-11173 SS5]|uniref:uncharacterized protein n=1 Tax=Punctularia strigosozonata (strain HHB-11173) TaxID=741275 RepID=UPI00044171B2|nr:uncharacterized protein PUNSTDRAFT_122372 [Punctularia strigosozonata HHB-11173 SS5]EIN05470.1 hypothetical protein PUNSTDRAFT_122372 [Punctularia strigosozonata HHB-11173 SS5]
MNVLSQPNALAPGGGAPANDGQPKLAFDPSQLPVASLESLRFKATQIIDSIDQLRAAIDQNGQNALPPWPDLLSKYNILLSQTHNFSNSLLPAALSSSSQSSFPTSRHTQTSNVLENLVLYPSVGMPDAQLDAEILPLLRKQQTPHVLALENATVRRLAAHLTTRGSLGVLLPSPPNAARTTYDAVLRECAQLAAEHDARAERAIRAVDMLRDKYDWRSRVQVEQEEPEELEWDPRVAARDAMGDADTSATPAAEGGESEGSGSDSDSENDEEELEVMMGEPPSSSVAGSAASTPIAG